jgi:2-hydroxy-3-keto-5-methylthiopentenyl-1-phosphate phosphatase
VLPAKAALFIENKREWINLLIESKIAYVLDFDGTVTESDITSMMARHYGGEHYPECSAAYHRGEFGMKEWLERMSAYLPPDREAILAFAKERAALRPGLKKFLRSVHDRGYPLYIASDGFGLYIEPILEMHGCREHVTKIFRNRTLEDSGRLKTLTPHAHRSCPVCGNCKASLVTGLLEKGCRVYYVGDGFNDRFAAAYADIIFARDRLAGACSAAGIPFQPWDDFHDLLKGIDLANNHREHRFCDPAGKGILD